MTIEDDEFKTIMQQNIDRLQHISEGVQSATNFDKKLEELEELRKYREKTISIIIDDFQKFKDYIDTLKEQRDEAIRQSHKLMNLYNMVKETTQPPINQASDQSKDNLTDLINLINNQSTGTARKE